jgi:hypothetical protein
LNALLSCIVFYPEKLRATPGNEDFYQLNQARMTALTAAVAVEKAL